MALLETFTDNFATADTAKWAGYGTNPSVSGGQLSIANPSGYPTVSSQAAWELTGSFLLIQLNQVPTTFPGGQGMFIELRVGGSGSNLVRWDWSASGQVTAVRTVGGSTTVVNGTAINYTAGMYLRIRESGGTIFWDYSLTGSTWTNAGSWAWTFTAGDMANMRVYLFAGPGPIDRPFLLDNMNLPPANSFSGSLATGGSSSLGASGSLAVSAPRTLTGSGTLSTAGAPGITGSFSGTGSGSLTNLTGSPAFARSLGLSGSSVLAMNGAPAFTGPRSQAGSSALDLTGNPSTTGQMTGGGSSSLALAGTSSESASGALALVGSSTLGLSVAAPSMSGSVATGGSSSLGMTGLPGDVIGGSLALGGSSALSPSGSALTVSGSVSLAGSGTLNLAGGASVSGTRALGGSSFFTGAGAPGGSGSRALTGVSTLVLTGAPQASSQQFVAGMSGLDLQPSTLSVSGGVALGAASQLIPAGEGQSTGSSTVSLVVASSLALTGWPNASAQAQLGGSSLLGLVKGANRPPILWAGRDRSPRLTATMTS